MAAYREILLIFEDNSINREVDFLTSWINSCFWDCPSFVSSNFSMPSNTTVRALAVHYAKFIGGGSLPGQHPHCILLYVHPVIHMHKIQRWRTDQGIVAAVFEFIFGPITFF